MQERTCFKCKHYELCYMRKDVHDTLVGSNHINIDGEGAPGRWADIFEALARACMQYKEG